MIHIDDEQNIAEWEGTGADLLCECAGVLAQVIWDTEQEVNIPKECQKGLREILVRQICNDMENLITEAMEWLNNEYEEEKADKECSDETVRTVIKQYRRGRTKGAAS